MAFTRNKGFKIGFKDHLVCQIVGLQLNVYVEDTNEYLWFDTLEEGAAWVLQWIMNNISFEEVSEFEKPFEYASDPQKLVPEQFHDALVAEIRKLK